MTGLRSLTARVPRSSSARLVRGAGHARGAVRAAVTFALLLFAGTHGASASPTAAKVDWATGLVTARGIGLGDRQAPNPAVARGPSRRTAEDAAKRVLAAALPALPLATGGTVGDKLGDPTIKARIDRAVAAAISLDAEPETDGSWRVTMGLPIEAVRLAVTGPRALPASGDDVVPVVIVDGFSGTPAVGYTIAGRAAATLWVTAVPPWARTAPRITARASKAGAIDAELGTTKAGDATLFVLVTK